MHPGEQPGAHSRVITVLFLASWHLTTAADTTAGPTLTHIDALAKKAQVAPIITTL